jgi:glycosyltransferase involved in cell wall biosynthesis
LFADAILRLLDDDGLRNRVLAGGFETVFRYSMKREARDTLAYFRQVAASAAPLERGGPRP